MKKKVNNLFLRAIKLTYLKLFRTNDSPHSIALGFGLGVFLGIMPGVGPLAALVIASVLRANKAAAVLGALLTNTWTSLLTILLAIKIGAILTGLKWAELYASWQDLLRNFHWKSLLSLSFLKIAFPVLLGYLVVSLILGLTAYFVIFIFLLRRRKAGGRRK